MIKPILEPNYNLSLPILIPPYLPCLIRFALQCAKKCAQYNLFAVSTSYLLKEEPGVCWSWRPQQLQLQTEPTRKSVAQTC